MAAAKINTTSLPHRYARAVFELATDAKTLAALRADFAALTDAMAATPLGDVLASGQLSPLEAEQLLAKLGQKMKFNTLTQRALAVIARRKRTEELADILAAFEDLRAHADGEVKVSVRSAAPLTAAQRSSIEVLVKDLRAETKTVVLDETTDPSLIAGAVLKVGATQIDTSVAGSLARLKLKLTY